jgi:hypothetical protein
VLWHAVLCVSGADAAVAYVSSSGIKLCALGADGQVLQKAGLKVRHSTPNWLWGHVNGVLCHVVATAALPAA